VTEGAHRAPRILVVEDDAINRAVLRAVLDTASVPELRRADVVEVETLTRARAVLAGDPFDLVLLDVRLPDGSGLALARELNSDAAGAVPVILALSAGVLPAEREAALVAGCHAFVEKPYTAQRLVAALMTHLPGRRPPAEWEPPAPATD
jgi:two-component system KDP operon response regulator KdpE